MPRPSRTFEEPADKVLIVEGSDDAHTLRNLLMRHGMDKGFSLLDGNGYENIRQSLGTRLKAGNEQQLGLLVDADSSLTDRWVSLRDVLLHSGYDSVPASPEASGTIIHQPERTTIGIWLMPDNQQPGMLEDFAASLLPPDDVLWPRAERAVREIPEHERRFGIHHSKAVLHTWLAWQEEPGKPIGQAITKNFLNPDAELAQRLVAWTRLLFDL